MNINIHNVRLIEQKSREHHLEKRDGRRFTVTTITVTTEDNTTYEIHLYSNNEPTRS